MISWFALCIQDCLDFLVVISHIDVAVVVRVRSGYHEPSEIIDELIIHLKNG
jgi:hypothetical protein